jgi:intein/homing endonuclease
MPTKHNPFNPQSNSEAFLNKRGDVPSISNKMYKSVSEYRRGTLASEVAEGKFKDGSGDNNGQLTSASFVTSSSSIKKNAQVVSGGAGLGYMGGMGDTVRQTPEVYSPLWLNSNLNLPRDRATINAWNRSFYALEPFIQNAINLHSTYPISKLNIKCPNKNVEKFFNEMIEDIDLMNVCMQIAQEYWLLGEAFVFAELDEHLAKWSRLVIQNPDYVVVKRSVIASEPLIMLRPDENLRRIVFSNKPSDIEQKNQLNERIVDHIRRGENIPLDNFYVSHLARRISPYEVRGTGLTVCCFRQLMLLDLIRECHDDQTEVLTKDGFKTISDIAIKSNDVSVKTANGVFIENNEIAGIVALDPNVEVACFNDTTNCIEYHKPEDLTMSYYEGEMLHFKSRNIDAMVSPNHKMWAQKVSRIGGKPGWSEWQKIPAKDIDSKTTYRFRGIADWKGKDIDFVEVLDKKVPIKLYLKFLGYLISEGCLTQKHTINFAQSTKSDIIEDMKEIITRFASIFDKEPKERIIKYSRFNSSKQFKKMPADGWQANIYSVDLNRYFVNMISTGDKCSAHFKQIPDFVKELSPRLLKIILEALVYGDGSHLKNKSSNAYRYYTASKKLADDVQEVAFKCGYAPTLYSRQRKNAREYTVSWSDAIDGNFPYILPNNKYPSKVSKVDYKGAIWCLQVPTGLLITRRNGKISMHGNSKFVQATSMINPLTIVKIGNENYKPTFQDLEAWRTVFSEAEFDREFKIFTHEGVSVERVGWNAGILDTSNDITQLLKEIFMGLMVPQVLMDGGGDITYANGGISLDVLRQRYMAFRNMMSAWLRKKIFAPISKLNDFYEYKDGGKTLIIPDVDWNHMSLFDTSDYVNVLMQMSTGQDKKVSTQTLYRSLGLDYDEERRKMRKEDVSDAIRKKEMGSLDRMVLNELRAIGEDDEIPEIAETALADQSPYADTQGLPGMDGTMMGGPGGLPNLSPIPGASSGLPPMPSSSQSTPLPSSGGAGSSGQASTPSQTQ